MLSYIEGKHLQKPQQIQQITLKLSSSPVQNYLSFSHPLQTFLTYITKFKLQTILRQCCAQNLLEYITFYDKIIEISNNTVYVWLYYINYWENEKWKDLVI